MKDGRGTELTAMSEKWILRALSPPNPEEARANMSGLRSGGRYGEARTGRMPAMDGKKRKATELELEERNVCLDRMLNSIVSTASRWKKFDRFCRSIVRTREAEDRKRGKQRQSEGNGP
ncbi:UNVERIFIED_CONTAM: hypothetical protein PYX00_001525 [Menopon gallinae]|uniref:Uncharacterized protein n=1 Tax=Menopon gallinae TaxID=328185 RepID=A0AAW2IE31_9NEOP